MSVNSTIDYFKRRYHGDSTLRLLTLDPTGQKLFLSREISKAFFIGREFDTNVGAYISYLTIDANKAGADKSEILGASFVDLVAPDDTYQRWRAETDTPPQILDDRFVLMLNAAFENRLPIDGTITYNPSMPTPTLHSIENVTKNFVCGYTQSIKGELIYLDASQKWQQADADTEFDGLLGMALEVKSLNQAMLVALSGTFVENDDWNLTVPSPIYMSETPGDITQVPPVVPDSATRIIGWAVATNKVYFYPSPDYITHA